MNTSVYIFGNLLKGYTQYPDDNFSSDIFQKIITIAKVTTQIAIHRDGNLMYYVYVRKLESGKNIGLCVVLNGLMITDFEGLFTLFENIISKLAIKGYLIKFNELGDLIPSAESLYLHHEEIDLVTNSLKGGINSLGINAKKLPPENTAVVKSSQKEFSIEDDSVDIIKSSYTNGFTFLYKSKGFNTAVLDSYKGVLSDITKKNKLLEKENANLTSQIIKVKRQKKQVQNVVLLCILIFVCGIGLVFLNDTLNFTQDQLNGARDTLKINQGVIQAQTNEIKAINEKNKTLTSSLSFTQTKYKQCRDSLDQFKNIVSMKIPILIQDFDVSNVDDKGNVISEYGKRIYGFETKYLKPRIKYIALQENVIIDLYVKLYDSDGNLRRGSSSPEGFCFSNSMDVRSGNDNVYEFSGWGSNISGHWSSGKYRYEIWYDNMCLGAKDFTVF